MTEIKYQNREPFDPGLEEFTRQTAMELDLDADSILIYPSSNSGGVYTGRKDNSPVIGISYDSKGVVAHELGHDRWAKIVENDFIDPDFELNEEGEIKVPEITNNRVKSIRHEIYAANVAATYVGREELFDREPIEWASDNLDAFSSSTKKARYMGQTFETYCGEKSPYKAASILVGWFEDQIKSILYFDRVEDPDTDKIDEEIYEHVSKNYELLAYEAMHPLFIKHPKSKIMEFLPPKSREETCTKPNPGHLPAIILTDMNTESLSNEVEVSYNHQVGNYVGRTLQELDIGFRDLEDNPENLGELAKRTLDLTLEIAKNKEYYTKDDYERGIEFLAKEHDFI